MGDAMAGVIECLLVLGKLRESTSGVADSSTASILLGQPGEYASAGTRSVSKWWRMAHPSSNDGDDGSGQRVWTKRWRALRTLPWTGSTSSWKEDSGPACWLEWLDGSRTNPLWKAFARAGARDLLFCSIHEQARRQSEENWEQRRRSVETGRWKRRDQKCNIATALVGRGTDVRGIWYGSDLSDDGTGASAERGVDGCRL